MGMRLILLAGLGALPVADGIERFHRLGLLVIPVVAFLVVLVVLIWKGQFRSGRQAGERTAEELRGKSAYPIASCCPQCGSREYSNAKDQEGAFVVLYDRICSACGARYTPPTPRWLAVTLIPLGVAVAAAGVALWFQLQSMETALIVRFLPAVLVLCGLYVSVVGTAKLRVQSAARPDNREDEQS